MFDMCNVQHTYSIYNSNVFCITCGRVPNGELYAQRLQNAFIYRLFHEISLQSLEQTKIIFKIWVVITILENILLNTSVC